MVGPTEIACSPAISLTGFPESSAWRFAGRAAKEGATPEAPKELMPAAVEIEAATPIGAAAAEELAAEDEEIGLDRDLV
jgi:hypothetical protein